MGLAELGVKSVSNIMGYLGNNSFLHVDYENHKGKPFCLKIR